MPTKTTFQKVDNGFTVDVGEADDFFVELRDVLSCRPISTSKNSILVKTITTDGIQFVVRVVWSEYKRQAQSRGYKAMEECESLWFVPILLSREMRMVGSTYVEVSVREYKDGVTAAGMWRYLTTDERSGLLRDVRAAVRLISRHTSSTFMRLQGRNLATDSPVQFLNYKILLSKLSLDITEDEMKTVQMDDFDHESVLCHGSLTLDHIIVKKGKLAGIIGWSKADYLPEVFDRMKYYMSAPTSSEAEWAICMARTSLTSSRPPPLYLVYCMYYHYYVRGNSLPKCRRSVLDRLLSSASDIVLGEGTGAYGDPVAI